MLCHGALIVSVRQCWLLVGICVALGEGMKQLTECDACAVILNVNDTCPDCGVYHGEPCDVCGQRGYHARECSALDRPENDDAAYL